MHWSMIRKIAIFTITYTDIDTRAYILVIKHTNGDACSKELVGRRFVYSISKPVADMVTASFNFSESSSLLSNSGKSIRLKHV